MNRFSGGQIILEKSLKCLYPLTHIPLSGIEYKELIKDVYKDIVSKMFYLTLFMTAKKKVNNINIQ